MFGLLRALPPTMDSLRRTCGIGILLGVLGGSGCGALEASSDSLAPGEGGSLPGGGNSDGEHGDGDDDSAPGDGDGASGPMLPPEQEESLSFETPRAGRTSVYVPNPATHRVAVVNAESFGIETVASGLQPTYATTVPGKDIALVINVGSADLTLLRTLNGKTQVQRLPLGHDANVIAISPNGKHAVVYFDGSRGSQNVTSFQDITVVDLTEGSESARGVSVGFRPQNVQFSSNGKQAFIVTEDGISVVELTQAVSTPTIARLVSLGDTLSDTLSVDVQVTADGHYAFARRTGDAAIRRVDLESEEIVAFSLESLQGAAAGNALSAGPIDLSDMDLAPDGSALLAVERARGALLRIPIPEGFDDPSLIDVTLTGGQPVGSVSIAKTGKIAVLYTTVGNVEGLVLVNLEGGALPRGVRLRKSVRAVAISDDGTRALVLHNKNLVAGIDEEARIDASEGYSLLDTESGFAKLQLTPARVRQQDIVVIEGTRKLFTLLRDDGSAIRTLQIADLDSFQVTERPLARPPSSIGLVPALDRVFVGQESAGGMITFFHGDSGEVAKAVSGFELASRIRQ